MTMNVRPRRWPALAGTALLLVGAQAVAQENGTWSPDSYRSGGEQSYSGPRPEPYPSNGDSYAPNRGSYGSNGSYASRSAGNGSSYAPGGGNGDTGTYSPSRGGYAVNGDGYPQNGGGYGGGNDAYSPARQGGYSAGESYSPSRGADSYSDPGQPIDGAGPGGYGEPYAAPPQEGYREGPPPREARTYEQNEIISAGHGFFGAISQGLGQAVEYAFKSQGRPNGYILGEDAGGAFVVGLRYGEGMLYTKDAGDHKVFWQGPSFGYDAGAEGSKAMVLVYNLHDPSEIYNRFGGVQGAAYLVGGLSVQFQTYGNVTLAVIRSGVGLRLGANVGYLKYTRAPTWNPL
ncbi:DUF1134 domain-containing protein [uncultured Hyphomicrobium sp.]|uniref:DUF1134 domain-containing protein n=1 Tax=uncultured Hyphomicrobium sp. TaxID=194373 RepID=UPI0025F29FF1|nr:DUF1134 domain-containing protein [uncultured Hyphomicrobium sp.]